MRYSTAFALLNPHRTVLRTSAPANRIAYRFGEFVLIHNDPWDTQPPWSPWTPTDEDIAAEDWILLEADGSQVPGPRSGQHDQPSGPDRPADLLTERHPMKITIEVPPGGQPVHAAVQVADNDAPPEIHAELAEALDRLIEQHGRGAVALAAVLRATAVGR